MNTIPFALDESAGVSVSEPNADATFISSAGGMSVFAGLVLSKRGKPNSVLELTKDNYLSVLGTPIQPHEGAAFEPIRHVKQALNGGNGRVVRVVPKATMRIPVLKLQRTAAATGGVQKIDTSKSIFTASPSTIPADDISRVLLSFVPKDSAGNIITGLKGITFSAQGAGTATISTTAETNGVYTAGLNAKTAGSFTVRVLQNGSPVGSFVQSVTLTPALIASARSQVTLSPSQIDADNKTTTTITLLARDSVGSVITGIATTLNFAVSGVSGVSVGRITEGTPGAYSATIYGSVAGVATIQVRQNALAVNGLSATLTLSAPQSGSNKVIDPSRSSFISSPSSIEGNGSDTAKLTLTVVDQLGNPIVGLAASLSMIVTGTTTPSHSGFTETAAGIYSASFWGTAPDVVTIKPQLNSKDIGLLSTTVTLTSAKTPTIDEGRSRIIATPNAITNDSASSCIITFNAVDASGNPVSGLTGISFEASGLASATFDTVQELAQGSFTAVFRSRVAGSASVYVRNKGIRLATTPTGVTVSNTVPVSLPDIDETISTVDVVGDSADADDSADITISLTALDASSQPILGITDLSFVSDDATQAVKVSAVTEINGVYSVTVTSSKAGGFKITPVRNGKQLSTLAKTVTFNAVLDTSVSTLTTSASMLVGDNASTVTLTYSAFDNNHTAMTGLTVTFEDSGATGATFGTVNETNGVYTTTMKAATAGTASVMAKVDGDDGADAPVTITVSAVVAVGVIDPSKTTFTADKTDVDAGDATGIKLTLTALDSSNAPVTGLTDLTFHITAASSYTLSAVTETGTGTGIYEATITSIIPGPVTIKAEQNNTQITGKEVTITFNPTTTYPAITPSNKTPSGKDSSFDVDVTTIAADGTSVVTVTFEPKTAAKAAMKGLTDVGFDISGVTGTVVSAVTESPDGVYKATIKSSVPGTITIAPTVSAKAVADVASKTVTITPVFSAAHSTFTASADTLEGDGVKSVTLTFTAKDNAAVPGAISVTGLTFETAGAGVTPGTLTPTETAQGSGIYTATLTATGAGTLTVTPKVGTKITALAKPITVTAKPLAIDPAKSEITVAPASAFANGTDVVTVTFVAKDDSVTGAPMGGLSAGLTFELSDATGLTPGQITEAPAGTYKLTYTATAAKTATVTVKQGGKTVSKAAGTITFATPVLDETTGLALSSETEVVGTAITATFTAKDTSTNKVPMEHLTITFELETPNADVTIGTVTEVKGVYSATITAANTATGSVIVKNGGTRVGTLATPIEFTSSAPPAPPVPSYDQGDADPVGYSSRVALAAPVAYAATPNGGQAFTLIATTVGVGETVVLGTNDEAAFYVDDGDASGNRTLSLTPDPDDTEEWVLTLKEIKNGATITLETVRFSLSPTALDDMGLPNYLPIKLENNLSRIRTVLKRDASFPLGYLGFSDEFFIGGTDGDMDSITPADYADALAVLDSSMVNYTAVCSLGIYDPIVLHELAIHAQNKRVDMFCDVHSGLNGAAAVLEANAQGFGGFSTVARYHFPYSSKDPISGAQIVFGLSGDVFTAKAAGVALNNDVGGWHYNPAGVSRGVLQRANILPLPSAVGIDRKAFDAARINPVAVSSKGDVYIDDELSTWAKDNYLKIQSVTSTFNAIARMSYDVCRSLQHEPDGITRGGLVRELTRLMERFVASEALVKPRDISQGEEPFKIEVTQVEFDKWNIKIYACPTGVSRRISIEPILFR